MRLFSVSNPSCRSASGKSEVRQGGFTLIEVMMAMLVFAAVAMIQQEVTASTVSQYLNIKNKIVASWIAENKIVELQIAKSLPAIKEYKEDIEYANASWQVISKVSKTANEDIHKLDVDVYLVDEQSGDKSKKLTLSSMLGRY